MPTEEELKKLALQNPGQLQTGATDPITGQRFESFAPNIINSDILTPSPALPYTTPQTQAAYPVAGLNSEVTLQPTEPEKKADEFSTQLQELNQRLLGQSSFRAEQEQAQKIPELQKTQTDLSAQLKGLQNEALAIPLQLQNEARGRGITVGGLAPIQAGKLRENAIKALTISSLLESSRGNLATAQTLVERAVAQKFDPIKEEIAVKTANLELILKSPAYSLAEKNRAQAQKDIQDAKLKKAEKEEADQKAILATATEAAKNGADALTLQNISKAKMPMEAIQAASGFLEKPEKPATTSDFTNYNLAGGLAGTGKSFNEWLQQKKETNDMSGMPNSWKEWQLAGAPGTYRDWVRKIGLRPLPPTQTVMLSEGKQIPLVTKSLTEFLDPNSKNYKGNLFGPVEGLKALWPWDKEHKKIDDDLRRASQTIGRYMEGGVLRKEDEEKYRKMLPQITDTVEVARNKLEGVKTLLAEKSAQYLADFEASGFDVSGFVGKLPGTEGIGEQDVLETYKQMRTNPELIPLIQSAEKEGYTPEQIVDYLKKKSKPISSGMRTDRHNNPTAFTTDVAKIAGLQQGVDYEVGDPFPNNPNLKTAKLLGDPIDTTIKVIDKIGFYTQGGKQRWTHTAISKLKWDNMTYEQKKNVIKQMYQKEGGKELLNAFA